MKQGEDGTDGSDSDRHIESEQKIEREREAEEKKSVLKMSCMKSNTKKKKV